MSHSNKECQLPGGSGLGTFSGVYLPSVLTIFGVIMYLRLGYVLGSLRLFPAILIICLSTCVTLLTALSIATSATNMRVKGGGAYYLISRAFGKELGAAIGVPLYLAQAIGIAFYIAGFVESVAPMLPQLSHSTIGIIALATVTLLAYLSTSLAVRTQGLILIMVIASLVSVSMGKAPHSYEVTATAARLRFWEAFALFFPAVTGIEAGLAMSGDLKNPTRSLVIGTISAVATGLVVYLGIACFLWTHVSRDQLLNDPLVVLNIARWKPLILMGIWGATLSSALGGIMGAPRTLQALARDGVLPSWLGKGVGSTDEPRVATLMTFSIAVGCIFVGRIDVLAPVLTMFFLISYGMLNLAAGLEGLAQNPSWRPTFRVPATVSLAGAAIALMAMFMIDAGSTFVAIFVATAIYFVMARSQLATGWDDIRQGVLYLFSRFAIYRLANGSPSPRSWRPNFIVFTDGFSASSNLLGFTSQITQGKGFLTVAPIFSSLQDTLNLESAQKRVYELFQRRKVEALVTVSHDPDPVLGMQNLIDNYGMGAIKPNTVVLGDSTKNSPEQSLPPRVILHAMKKMKNVVVIVGEAKENFTEQSDDAKEATVIDVWWDNENKRNSELMLVLAYMHKSSGGYGAITINIKCTVTDEAGREQRRAFFEQFFAESRLEFNIDVYVAEEKEDIPRLMGHFSSKADVVLHGLRPPAEEESLEEYTQYYRALIRSHKHLNNVVYAMAMEPFDLRSIFA